MKMIERWEDFISGVLLTSLCILGLLGNLVTLLILNSTREMRNQPINIYLTVLALYDNGVLFNAILMLGVPGLCKLLNYEIFSGSSSLVGGLKSSPSSVSPSHSLSDSEIASIATAISSDPDFAKFVRIASRDSLSPYQMHDANQTTSSDVFLYSHLSGPRSGSDTLSDITSKLREDSKQEQHLTSSLLNHPSPTTPTSISLQNDHPLYPVLKIRSRLRVSSQLDARISASSSNFLHDSISTSHTSMSSVQLNFPSSESSQFRLRTTSSNPPSMTSRIPFSLTHKTDEVMLSTSLPLLSFTMSQEKGQPIDHTEIAEKKSIYQEGMSDDNMIYYNSSEASQNESPNLSLPHLVSISQSQPNSSQAPNIFDLPSISSTSSSLLSTTLDERVTQSSPFTKGNQHSIGPSREKYAVNTLNEAATSSTLSSTTISSTPFSEMMPSTGKSSLRLSRSADDVSHSTQSSVTMLFTHASNLATPMPNVDSHMSSNENQLKRSSEKISRKISIETPIFLPLEDKKKHNDDEGDEENGPEFALEHEEKVSSHKDIDNKRLRHMGKSRSFDDDETDEADDDDGRYDKTDPRTLYITFVYPLALISQTGSIWTTCLITAERYFAIAHPLRALTLSTKKRAGWALIIMTLIAIVYNLPRFFEVHIIRDENDRPIIQPSALRNNGIYYWVYHICLYMALLYIIPLSLLAILNTKIYLAIKKANADRSNLTRHQESELNIAFMLVVLVAIFMACNGPAFVVNILELIEAPYFQEMILFSNLLVCFNSSVNFVIYCTFGKKFRERLVSSISCSSSRVPHRTTPVKVRNQQNNHKTSIVAETIV